MPSKLYRENELDAKLATSPFGSLTEAEDFLAWFETCPAPSEWDKFKAESARHLLLLRDRLAENFPA